MPEPAGPGFTRATPVWKPLVLSYKSDNEEDPLSNNTVPSESGTPGDRERKIAYPFRGADASTFAHPTAIEDDEDSLSITAELFGASVKLAELAMIDPFGKASGNVKGLPSFPYRLTRASTEAPERLTSVI